MIHIERLSELESSIHKHRNSYYLIGKALKEIRDKRLYQHLLFKTFEAYTKERWEMGKSQAYRLIEACCVIDNLSPIGDTLPENESQVRALTSLSSAEQQTLWRDFLSTGMGLNTSNIRNFIADRRGSNNYPKQNLTEVISETYKAAVLEMLEQIRLAQNQGWQKTSREAALFWLKVMKEKITLTLSQKEVQNDHS